MFKMKIKFSVKKCFKVIGFGKIKRKYVFKSYILIKKFKKCKLVLIYLVLVY